MTKTNHAKSSRIQRRKDVYPNRGKHEYGNVKFADPVNNKYPIDTPKHIRAAWSCINHKHDAAKYDKADVARIKRRIKNAAKRAGIDISTD
jgi:hypothetical protein